MSGEADAATEHIGAGTGTTMSIDAIVTELSTLRTGAAREVVMAAQIIQKGKQEHVRNLCRPWGV